MKYADAQPWVYLTHNGKLFEVITESRAVINYGATGRLWDPFIVQNYGLDALKRYVIVQDVVEPGPYDHDDGGHVCQRARCKQLVNEHRLKPLYEEKAASWDLVTLAPDNEVPELSMAA